MSQHMCLVVLICPVDRGVRALLGLFSIWLAAGMAQLSSPVLPRDEAAAIGSVSGRVFFNSNGPQSGEVSVTIAGPVQRTTTVDVEGYYALKEIPAGKYVLKAARGPVSVTRILSLRAGQIVTSFDLTLASAASVSGRVLDENGQPLPGVYVSLIGREYQFGGFRYSSVYTDKSDDRGAYSFPIVSPNNSYLIQARVPSQVIDGISSAPADPRLRRPVRPATFYPDALAPEAASPMLLSPGQEQSGIDIRLSPLKSYCIEGQSDVGAGLTPAKFRLIPNDPSFGTFLFASARVGASTPDGRFRICDLYSRDYKLIVYRPASSSTDSAYYGEAVLTIHNSDLRRVAIQPPPRIPLVVRFALDRSVPENMTDVRASLELKPLNGVVIDGVDPKLRATVPVPGEYSYPALRVDAYEIRIGNLPEPLCVRDILHLGRSILRTALELGKALGPDEVQVVIGAGGFVTVVPKDDSGEPAVDTNVMVFPAGVLSERELADSVIFGKTDQDGVYSSEALPPGIYRVLLSHSTPNRSPNAIARIWHARSVASEISITAAAAAVATPNVRSTID